MSTQVALIILAAGKGTRMQSDLPKVLHKIGQAPLLAHAIDAGLSQDPARVIVVTGHGADAVEAVAQSHTNATCVLQHEQLGTGHAVAQARPALAGFAGDAIVLYGDTPFIRPETLEQLRHERARYDIVVLGFEAADPGRYGRLVTNGDDLDRIVEFKDTTDAERAINLCNSGVLCADSATLMDLVSRIGNDNAAGEYYLTDIVAIARARGLRAGVVRCDEAETLGINTRAELASAEALFQSRTRAEAIEHGVVMQAPETVFFAHGTHVGAGAEIEPYVVFGPGVSVESDAHIRAFSHLEGCHVSRGAVVGPYARLRPGAQLDEDTRVGNFVEVKNTRLHQGAKANHLTYLGDADIGARSNIGAGIVTCNYDGFGKHKTTIGEGAFVGSGTMLVAPVQIGAGALVGSGSTITESVPDDALAIARARQENKPGLARKLRDLFEKRAAARKGK